MNVVGEVDQANEVDEENLTRRHKPRRHASMHDSDEQEVNDVDARIGEVRPGGSLALLDSADRQHLQSLKKQIEEIDGVDSQNAMRIPSPHKMQL